MEVVKWTEIAQFHQIIRGLRKTKDMYPEFTYPTITYAAKTKLHGTNAGVQIWPDNTIIAQGRNTIFTPEHDNYGFAKWVKSNEEYFQELGGIVPKVIFGEWCGQGISKGTAINSLKDKILFVYAIQFQNEEGPTLLIEPWEIERILSWSPRIPKPKDVVIIPWKYIGIVIDYGNQDSIDRAASIINNSVAEIETADTWVNETFGLSGKGEGFVFYPYYAGKKPREVITNYIFKAKIEDLTPTKQKKPAQTDPQVAESIDKFVELVVTEARLEQGLQEACHGDTNIRCLGAFLKWINQDIEKENQAELEASGLTWKQVSRQVAYKAKKWFQTREGK